MRKRKGSRVAQRILLTVIAVTVGAAVYLVNAKTLLGDALPMPFGYGGAVVLSGSMEPALSVDDLVIVRKSGAYAAGDIVVYQEGRSLIIHRIVYIDGESVITQGDANNTADEEFPVSEIKGKLVYKVSGVGRAVRIMSSRWAVIGVLLAAAGLFLLSCRKERAADEADIAYLKTEIEKLKAERNETDRNRKSE